MALPHHINAHSVLSIGWPGQTSSSSYMHHLIHLVHGYILGKASCPVHSSCLYKVGLTPPSETGWRVVFPIGRMKCHPAGVLLYSCQNTEMCVKAQLNGGRVVCMVRMIGVIPVLAVRIDHCPQEIRFIPYILDIMVVASCSLFDNTTY